MVMEPSQCPCTRPRLPGQATHPEHCREKAAASAFMLPPLPLPRRRCSPLRPFARYFTSSAAATSPSDRLLHRLRLSKDRPSIRLARQSHAQLITLGLHRDSFFASKLVAYYSFCGSLSPAHSVFDSVPAKNVFLYNFLISGYARNCFYHEPLFLFQQMCRERLADNYSFATTSKVCGQAGDLGTGEAIHCQVLKCGFASDTVVSNSIIAMYCKCGSFVDARKVFDQMPLRNAASWNILISECASVENSSLNEEILGLVKSMQAEGIKVDGFTVASLLPLCANETASGAFYGRQIHCFVIRNGLCSDLTSCLQLGSCLISMYSKCNSVAAGRRVFDGMMYRNVVSWTAMIGGYVLSGDFREAFVLFRSMQVKQGVVPNHISLITVLSACRSFAGLVEGRQVHAFAIRSHLIHDVELKNALIDMYSKCGSLKSARAVFDANFSLNDEISWSSLISGYGLNGAGGEAILLFNKMCSLGIEPNHVNSVGVLSACERAGLVSEGLDIYDMLAREHGLCSTEEICSCMVGMLGKSGQLDRALHFINSMPVETGPSVWSALLDASVTHGNLNMQELACKWLLKMEPNSPSNYVTLSNVRASSGRWNSVSEVRSLMKKRGLKKLPGCSWINVDNNVHAFFVADKSHPCSELIYSTLQNLVSVMAGANLLGYQYLA